VSKVDEKAAGSIPAPASNQNPVLLESDVSLSNSLIWRLQREFYVQRGLKAWTEDLVPNFITNNPFIAEIYARVVFGFLTDCDNVVRTESRPLSALHPLRILELGAGPGKFSFLFLRHLTALMRAKGIALETVRYRMTDCAENLIQAWRSNRYLAEFVACGMLEFELLQAGEGIESSLIDGHTAEASAPTYGPLVLIANYVFDSLPHDAFVIQSGQILEALVTTTGPGGSTGDSGPEPLSRLRLSFKNAGVPSHRYADQSWNDILETYRGRLSVATVLFPGAVLKTLQEISRCSDGRMLVLAADKGFVHEEDLALCQGPPALEFHGGNCFSQDVNFDAIGKYFQIIGGEALLPSKHSSNLNICAFLQSKPDDQFSETRAAYQDAQAAFGPDDLFTLFAWLNAHMEEMSVPQILAALRLGHWDPITLVRLFPVLARQLQAASRERIDLRDAVMCTWDNHYPVHPGENIIAFYCGVILLELRFYEDALSMFKTSQQIFGGSAATSYNLGLCSLGLGRASEALAFMVEACNLDPAFEPARISRRRLEQENARG
jgi:tetratricopeptide (TPR) repeat protein